MSEPFKMTPEEIKEAELLYVNCGPFASLTQVFNKFPRIYAFRPYREGDEVVTLDRTSLVVNHSGERPHFILRPRKKITVTDYVFKATGETRVPRAGEWYKSSVSGELKQVFVVTHPNNLYTHPQEIYTREEITREIEVDE